MALDSEKILLYKRYCAKSAQRMLDRDLAREQLKEQLDALRAINPKAMQAKIDELERRIAEAIEREGRLRTHHNLEDMFHRKLRDRMEALEKRIGKYLQTREERLARIAELEDKVAKRLSDRNEQVAALKAEVEHLERMAEELEVESHHTRKIAKLRERIGSIKKDIEAKAA
jgi:chromosome segregation ATPase